jgi:hypothetical protein
VRVRVRVRVRVVTPRTVRVPRGRRDDARCRGWGMGLHRSDVPAWARRVRTG